MEKHHWDWGANVSPQNCLWLQVQLSWLDTSHSIFWFSFKNALNQGWGWRWCICVSELHFKKLQREECLVLLCLVHSRKMGRGSRWLKSHVSHKVNNNTRTRALVLIKIFCVVYYWRIMDFLAVSGSVKPLCSLQLYPKSPPKTSMKFILAGVISAWN